ncbi:MAG: 50S ribosomal protein L22 [Firmicutes bacterium ADurb.Bin467]|nr:MAG: 50S ribosomal protein L22 [Firmicutes bacterium ADurb.Bin467]
MATRVKQKAAARKANADKRPHASAKYVRVSPRKVQIVIDLIRGKQVDDALAILMYTPKAAAPVVEKLLISAIANAENNLEMDRQSLFVAEVFAKKHTSHITIVLDQKK